MINKQKKQDEQIKWKYIICNEECSMKRMWMNDNANKYNHNMMIKKLLTDKQEWVWRMKRKTTEEGTDGW